MRPVHTFVLTGSADPIIIADDIRVLFGRLPSPKRLVVLGGAGHVHCADRAEQVHERMRAGFLSGHFPDPEIDAIAVGQAIRPFSELRSERDAADVGNGLCLAHMDAHLKEEPQARAFLEANLAALFAARGVSIELSEDRQRMAAI